MTAFHTETGTDLKKAALFLEADETVAIPTETVYGLAGNALHEKAVHKIFAAKKRPLYNPLIVHIKGLEELDKYAKEIPAVAYHLFEHFSPGPLTIILPKKSIVPYVTTAGKADVAIRIPNHPLTLELLNQLDFPLAAPSANPFGYISPTTAEHVMKQLGGKIPYILDGGPCIQGLESTVIGFQDGMPFLHRLGALRLEELQSFLPDIRFKMNDNTAPVSPGMLSQHYSPNTVMYLAEDLYPIINNNCSKKIGVISLSREYPEILPERMVILSSNADLNEAAPKLYAALHYLDSLELDMILVERMPEYGMGLAMNDRMERAAAKFS